MDNPKEKTEELKLENENLELRIAIVKEPNKDSWIKSIWALVPFIGVFYWFVNVFL